MKTFDRRIVLFPAVVVAALRYSVRLRGDRLTQRAKGEFDVKVLPVAQDAASGLGRMSIDKTFRGDLVGTSVGEMLTAMSPVEGSGAYVAVERVRERSRGERAHSPSTTPA